MLNLRELSKKSGLDYSKVRAVIKYEAKGILTDEELVKLSHALVEFAEEFEELSKKITLLKIGK